MKILTCTVWDYASSATALIPPLISSNAPEDDHPEFNGPTIYSAGQRVVRSFTHRIYERLTDGEGGLPPEFNPTNWRVVGWTRPYRMLDGRTDTATTFSGGALEVVIPASNASTLAMFGLVAESVTVSVADSGGAYVYTRTKSLRTSSVADWLGYFFDGYGLATEVIFDDLPMFNTQTIRVTIAPVAGSAVSCAMLQVGRPQHLGDVQINGTTFGIRDYSKKELDEFGVATLVRRSFAERATFKVEVPNGRIAWLQTLLAAERAKPVVWIGDDDVETYAPLFICGFYRDFQTNLTLPTRSYCSIEVEGLI